ncbi:DUF3841 domain-containing protein [Brevibacterium zhoupengii]|uniref:DUF3841 domain-containing protein n=1 Tax=Brevibacterium zhoupengii TaxID=2898795 RepID=UPI001F09C488|nr:DUF3841 domain-containing protein [Brevibacterium zhoupengii]
MPETARNDRSCLRAFDDLPAVPWFIAPLMTAAASRRASRAATPRQELLTLSTFQTKEAYDALLDEGVLIGDPTRGWDEFQEAYAWLMRAMEDRGVPGPAGGMVWLWPNPTQRRIRTHAKQAKGDVLLTACLPPDQVLISEFADWHLPLNRMLHVPRADGEDYGVWDERARRVEADFDSRLGKWKRLPLADWPLELRDEIENSWEAIFDSMTWQPDSTLQATAHQLHADDVIDAVRIR